VVPRFYAPDARDEGQILSLTADDAAHFTRVLRGRAGDRVRVFDGRGREFAATVHDARVRTVTVALGPAVDAAAEHRTRITLVPAVLKGDKTDAVVRDAVMMGVAHIQPIVSMRTGISVAALERGERTARWNRVAVASAKQCGRAILPAVAPPVTFDDCLAAVGPVSLMFVEPGEVHHSVPLTAVPAPETDVATVLIGPEGGWTAEEIARGSTACRLVTLQGPTLRADAMPLVALAALLARWNQL
jgi:16S rRNA (uracil1498-N3)-methyltransferase